MCEVILSILSRITMALSAADIVRDKLAIPYARVLQWQALRELVPARSHAELVAFLPAWAKAYARLVIDNDRRGPACERTPSWTVCRHSAVSWPPGRAGTAENLRRQESAASSSQCCMPAGSRNALHMSSANS